MILLLFLDLDLRGDVTFIRWTVLKATAMIKNRYPREWIVRQLQRFQGLSPGKGNWDLIRTQILREVDEATGDRT